MVRLIVILGLLLSSGHVLSQETPASPVLMTLGPVDGESDQKTSIITARYDSKPAFERPRVEAHGSFIQVILPNTIVPQPGKFMEAHSPYIRKFAVFQLDEQTAGLRLFVTKEAEHIVSAFNTDILENRVVVVLDHALAEKSLEAHFQGVPVQGGPTSQEIVERTEIRRDLPDPAMLTETSQSIKSQAADPAPITQAGPQKADWGAHIEDKMVAMTIFLALMLVLLIAIKSWRRVASKGWSLTPGEEFSLKTLATHSIGPKQKLTVVQVGQEQILLGISPDQISFLTSLQRSQPPSHLGVEPSIHKSLKSPLPKRAADQVLPEVPRPVGKGRKAESQPLPEPGSAIAYGIADDGIKDMKSPSLSRSQRDATAVEDVTQLIRKKLRDLPKV